MTDERGSASLCDVVFDSNPLPMWIYDAQTLRFLSVNDAAVASYGYSREQFLTMSLLDIRPREERHVLRSWATARDTAQAFRTTGPWRQQRADGSILYVEAANSHGIVFEGRTAVLAMIFDVTERDERIRVLEEHRIALQEAQLIADVGSFMLDASKLNFRLGGTLVELYGREEIPFAEIAAEIARVWHADDRLEAAKLLQCIECFEPYDGEFRVHMRAGVRWMHGRTKVIRDANGSPSGTVGVAVDITERRAEAERLRFLAFRDAATGLPNRAALLDLVGPDAGAFSGIVLVRVTWITEAAHRSQEARTNTARAIAAKLRGLAPADAQLFRYSDQTFAVLTNRGEGALTPLSLAKRVASAFERPLVTDSGDYVVIPTIAVAAAEADSTMADLDRRGEAALHEAGRRHDRSAVYSTELELAHDRRATIDRHLRAASSDLRASVVYQPIVSLATGYIVGAEALMRWDCPGIGPVSPSEFIAIAEDSGVILSIGEWVLRSACLEARAWQLAGLGHLRIAVNVSAREVEQREFALTVASACESVGLLPSDLELEITERVIMQRDGLSLRNLEALRALGVRISIDDFGTGYSSLSYLAGLPLDTLKLDRAFVVAVVDDPFQAKLVASVIDLARERGLNVVGEGVETAAELDWLRGHACDEAQGYLFSVPIAATEFRALVARTNHHPASDGAPAYSGPVEPSSSARSQPPNVAPAS